VPLLEHFGGPDESGWLSAAAFAGTPNCASLVTTPIMYSRYNSTLVGPKPELPTSSNERKLP
jgi:hypothetical protein